MSVVGAAVVLGVVIVMLLRLRVLRPSGALVCVLFGLVLAATPIGGALTHGLQQVGDALWREVTRL
ncbi:hypothetical protein [uncultured Friedmanniella sp.]|uniref:hypothetical protein n=1 Tax=uncultured Friedmanniella sp. TaxID=335381 RepID=UPI0035CBA2EA